MGLVFAGHVSHGPGITARAELADPDDRDSLYAAFDDLRQTLEASEPDVLVVVAAEHFANFFMNNMPAFAMGMAEWYEGPIEKPEWLRIERVKIPGDAAFSAELIRSVMNTVDVAYAQEWQFDHGVMVPLHFMTPRYDLAVVPVNVNCQGPPLTPLHRAWAFGEALRAAIDASDRRVALLGTGGGSHWPATPDSGKINEEWDLALLDAWCRADRDALTSYTDEQTYVDAGQGSFEMRTQVVTAAATADLVRTVHYYRPIPVFSLGCTIASADTSSLGVPGEAGRTSTERQHQEAA